MSWLHALVRQPPFAPKAVCGQVTFVASNVIPAATQTEHVDDGKALTYAPGRVPLLTGNNLQLQ
jgi:hypothetical protein